jgi:hypothetical protein
MKKLNGIKVKEILVRFINNEELELNNDVIIDLENEINSLSDGVILFEFLCSVCVELAVKMEFDYGGDVEIIESVLYELGLEEDEVLELVDGYVNS